LALGQAPDAECEPESSGANLIPIIEDDEAIDEEDKPTQAYISSYIALRKKYNEYPTSFFWSRHCLLIG
jgi:hypothetical protein